MLRAIIVDDEELSRKSLATLIGDFCEGAEVVCMVSSVAEAIAVIDKEKPDVVFLDIQMHKETGFDLLRKIGTIDFDVIFTTAHAEYAIDAIRFSAVDYLLKPIDINDLKRAISRVQTKRTNHDFHGQLESLLHNLRVNDITGFRLAIPSSDGLLFIGLKDILYCEADGNYTTIHMSDNKSHVVSKTLKEYENLLGPYNFLRVHHSFLVNIKEIKQYVRGDGGYIIMNNNVTISVAQRKKEGFLKMMDGMVLRPFTD